MTKECFKSHETWLGSELLKDVTIVPHLKHWRHEDGAAHQGEDHEACGALLPDSEELGLFPRSRALRLQFQAVNVGDGEDGGRYKPRQAHQRAHAQHHPDHQQVQMVSTAFLKKEKQMNKNEQFFNFDATWAMPNLQPEQKIPWVCFPSCWWWQQ